MLPTSCIQLKPEVYGGMNATSELERKEVPLRLQIP